MKDSYDNDSYQVLDLAVAKTNKVCTIIILILQMGKLRHRAVKKLALSHTPDK